jgi:DNA-binding transcriptional LysR family regulator
MQLVALRYFVAVADHGSFNAAAERLGVSTSTLTRSVSTLEDDLGLTLFERSRRSVQLVRSALPVLEETKKMLSSLEAIASAADGAARGTKGELRLGVRSPPLGEPLRGMLARWRKDHPGVRFIVHELSDHDLLVDLVARRIDVALVPSFAPWPQIVMEGLPLQSVPAGKQTVFSLVSAGSGVTLAQQSQAEASFPGVVFKPVDETNARVEFCLAWSPQSECAVIGRFLASMRESAARRGAGASAIQRKPR